MTGKERMLIALAGGVPDRLPVTIHQWQLYHLQTYMGGVDQLEAFQATGLDASITVNPYRSRTSSNWDCRQVDTHTDGNGETHERHIARTPKGTLTWTTASNQFTTFVVEHPVKNQADMELYLAYFPGFEIDREIVADWYERTGDAGIIRGYLGCTGQPGPWQDLCELVGTEQAILWAMDDPQTLHANLEALTQMKVRQVHEQLKGSRYDLIEHGGGAASCTVISPAMFREFCLPYDKRIIDAMHEEGFKVVYHTCGGMMSILDDIPANGCNASETLSPPGVGGDIKTAADRAKVKATLGSKVALIGGIDQHGTLTLGSPEDIRRAVADCFKIYGQNGGYICSASDHFFETPLENLYAFAAAARECVY